MVLHRTQTEFSMTTNIWVSFILADRIKLWVMLRVCVRSFKVCVCVFTCLQWAGWRGHSAAWPFSSRQSLRISDRTQTHSQLLLKHWNHEIMKSRWSKSLRMKSLSLQSWRKDRSISWVGRINLYTAPMWSSRTWVRQIHTHLKY